MSRMAKARRRWFCRPRMQRIGRESEIIARVRLSLLTLERAVGFHS